MTSSQRTALRRLVEDDLLIDALGAAATDRAAEYSDQLVDLALASNPNLTAIVKTATLVRTWRELIGVLHRAAEEAG